MCAQNAFLTSLGRYTSPKRHSRFNAAQGIWRKASGPSQRQDKLATLSQDEQAAAADKVLAMFAEKIQDGKYVPPSTISVSQADALIHAGSVTPRQLDKLGIAFSVPWDRKGCLKLLDRSEDALWCPVLQRAARA